MGVFQPVQIVWHVCLIFTHSIEVNFFSRTDYYVSKASNWMQDKYIDDVKEQIHNTIGVDITSATEREEFACAVYSRFSAHQLLPPAKEVMFSQASVSHLPVCSMFPNTIIHRMYYTFSFFILKWRDFRLIKWIELSRLWMKKINLISLKYNKQSRVMVKAIYGIRLIFSKLFCWIHLISLKYWSYEKISFKCTASQRVVCHPTQWQI